MRPKPTPTRKTGRGGATIPYSSIADMLLGSVRGYAAILRRIKKFPLAKGYKNEAMVSQHLTEFMQNALGDLCLEEDVVAVAQAIGHLCANSAWAREEREDA